MPKLRGTIKRTEIEGGVFQLHTSKGEIFELPAQALAGDPALGEGASVEVDGDVDRNVLSFTMTAPRLTVKSIRKV